MILLGKTSVSMYYNGRNLFDSLRPLKKKAVLKEQKMTSYYFCGVMSIKSSKWKPLGVEKRGGGVMKLTIVVFSYKFGQD